MPEPKYRSHFFKSPHHAIMGLATLGAGFISAEPLYLLCGVAAYALGWIYLPDLGFFKKWVDRKAQSQAQDLSQAELGAFIQQRDQLLARLNSSRRHRYQDLAKVCQDIEENSTTPFAPPGEPDVRLRKLDELMWSYLRMLVIEESLEKFLQTERSENLSAVLKTAQAESNQLVAEVEEARKSKSLALSAKERLLQSRLERLQAVEKRVARLEQAEANYELVKSEQERLDQLIKLIRSEAFASKDAGQLSARIDSTLEHLNQTNQWLAEMDEFREDLAILPQTSGRLGYGKVVVKLPPKIPAKSAERQKEAE